MYLRKKQKSQILTFHFKPKPATTMDNWESPQNILVILAHPDDPEFFCGATLAKWARQGHHITYQLITCGDKGFNESTPAEMTTDRFVPFGMKSRSQQQKDRCRYGPLSGYCGWLSRAGY
jgi:hypothetical protein